MFKIHCEKKFQCKILPGLGDITIFCQKNDSAFLFSLFFLLWLIEVYLIPGMGMVCLCHQDLCGVGSNEVKKSSGGPWKRPNHLGKGLKNTQNGKKWQKMANKHILPLNFFLLPKMNCYFLMKLDKNI